MPSATISGMWSHITITIYGTEIGEEDWPYRYQLELSLDGEEFSDERVRALVDDALGPHYDGASPHYRMERVESVTEWGASSALLDIGIAVSTEVVARVGAHLLERIFTGRYVRRIGEPEAIEHARLAVSVRYSVPVNQLVVTGAKQDGDQWTVTLHHEVEIRTYIVTLLGGRNQSVYSIAIEWREG